VSAAAGTAGFTLLKVGGSCLAERTGATAAALPLPPGRLLVVHGYSARLAAVRAAFSVAERPYTSPSGVASRFSDEGDVAAARLAAFLDARDLAAALAARGVAVTTLAGDRGALAGERKTRLRYRDGRTVRLARDDLSGKLTGVDRGRLDAAWGDARVLVLSPFLASGDGPLVCDADHAAAGVAVACGLAELTLVSDSGAFRVDGHAVAEVTAAEIAPLLAHASGGMSKKLHAVRRALEGGVRRVLLRAPDGGAGTVFRAA